MAKVMSLQQALKGCLVLILVMVILYAGGGLSDRLIASQSAGLRWLGVATAIVILLPWLPIAMGIWMLSVGLTLLYYRANL